MEICVLTATHYSCAGERLNFLSIFLMSVLNASRLHIVIIFFVMFSLTWSEAVGQLIVILTVCCPLLSPEL